MSNNLSACSSRSPHLTDRSGVLSTKKISKPSIETQVVLRGDGLQRLLTTEDVAAILGIAPATAIWWRSQRQGPQWMRLGRGKRAPIRYRPDAINAYIAQMECAEH
ncbi:helix-turn-helix domain-containing protein [Microvirga makkahensis]|uniref:Helix-turn-helix domain-containing protein n=1 Tax=Microvirga makkahensis TaxID=1128670 RepID=A0A7X3MUS9_9HYPH|nr:helix-turn-helix domain-containing protein [Microvirga makkahensis]